MSPDKFPAACNTKIGQRFNIDINDPNSEKNAIA